MNDDLGFPVNLTAEANRVVSLVPSLTEAIAATRPGALIGATDWCTHPADLDVTRVRGTKNPNVKAIIDLAPDVVVTNKEENRELDVRRLREAGVPVWVTDIETIDESFTSMRRLFDVALGWGVPDWLTESEALWREPIRATGLKVAVAIWRDPWMVVGRDTYTGDLLTRLGVQNVFAEADGRYPHVELAALDDGRADLILLPDEPYVFTADDGPEAFAHTPTRLCSGRALTWYGPAMLEARGHLMEVLGFDPSTSSVVVAEAGGD